MKFTKAPLLIFGLAVLITGCQSLPDISGQLDKGTFSKLSTVLTNVPSTVANIFNNAGIQPGPMIRGTNASLIIADGATNYIVDIYYSDLDPTTATGRIDAVGQIYNLGTSLLALNPGLSDSLFSLSTSNLNTLATLFDLLNNLKSMPTDSAFQTNFASQIHELLDDQLSQAAIDPDNPSQIRSDIHVSLQGLVAAYLKSYMDGTFVDRWGVPLSQPDITRTGNVTTVAITKVMVEALFDYVYMTPIINDPNLQPTNKTPTFAVIFPRLYEKVSSDPDRRGITGAESEAIRYLSGLSDEEAKHLSSLIIRAVGGASVGVKISTGDNDTLAQIISTFCEELARRTAEHATYNFFERFQYAATTNNVSGYVPDLAANKINLPGVNEPAQNAAVALLVSQDFLKNLLRGGWKLSSNDVTNYNSLKAALTNMDGNLHSVFVMLPPSAQANLDQEQITLQSINDIIQTNQAILDITKITPSLEAQNLILRNPQKSDLAHLNYLLIRNAINAVPTTK